MFHHEHHYVQLDKSDIFYINKLHIHLQGLYGHSSATKTSYIRFQYFRLLKAIAVSSLCVIASGHVTCFGTGCHIVTSDWPLRFSKHERYIPESQLIACLRFCLFVQTS